MREIDKKIERFNKKTTHFLWIVLVSMITSIITMHLYLG